MRLSSAALVAGLAWLLDGGTGATEPAARPNVVVIVADDLGYSDVGAYGGEIETPNLDSLARGGLRFTDFYNTGRCWPTRASLLTGYYAQQIRRDGLPGIPIDDEDLRPWWAPLLPARLRPLGYRSYHSGKWHVDGGPVAEGFDHSYLLSDQGRYFNPEIHYEDDQELPPVRPKTGYYATTVIADYAIRHLQQHAKEHPRQPFFQFIAFTAPHFPLQALAPDVARYRDRYRRGWGVARRERWLRVRGFGLVNGWMSAVEHDLGPPYAFPGWQSIYGPGEVDRPLPWVTLNAEQQEFQAMKMAIHAAMVDRVDREVGRVLDQLRVMNAVDNTLILFLSDNGASSELSPFEGHDPSAQPGSAATYYCLGPGWSTVCNTPFRRHKTWVHEGGISTPLIAHWPQGIAARGELRHDPGHVIDLVPTILELAGGAPSPRGRGKRVPPMPGRSLVSAFTKDGSVERDYLWWYHEGNRGVRVDNFKLVASAGTPWELYDLTGDRAESNNLAASMGERVIELSRLWHMKARQFARDAGWVPGQERPEPASLAHPSHLH